MSTDNGSPRFRIDAEGAGSYFKLSEASVAYSVPLSQLVIADYDAKGNVRGIEFVGKQTKPIEAYIAEAQKQERRKPAPARGAIPGRGAVAKSA